MYEKKVTTCYCDLEYRPDSLARFFEDSTLVIYTLEFYNNDSLIYYKYFTVGYYNWLWQLRFDRSVSLESFNYQYNPEEDILWIAQMDSTLKIRVVYNKIIFNENTEYTDVYYYTLTKPKLN